VSGWFSEQVGSGSMLLALPVALVAGLLSFVSPCTLPMLPGYLSYSTGLAGADVVSGRARRSRMLAGAALFVLGFAAVFVLLGVAVGSVAVRLQDYRHQANTVLGILSIVMGLAFIGLIPWLQRDVRVHRIPAVGLAAAPLLGFLFGLGWTPCNGPTLGVITGLAYEQGGATRGGILLAAYALGLGIPFLIVAIAWRRALVAVAWLRRHTRAVTIAGGVLMILIGLALLTGWWDYVVQQLQVWVNGHWGGVSV
jgi:cytochrome c-type biogenesis protein